MNNIIMILLLYSMVMACVRGIDIFNEFMDGVKEGMYLVLTVFPTLMAFMVWVNLFMSCGLVEMIEYVFKPLFDLMHIPVDVLMMMIIRPFSSSGSLSIATNVFKTYGVDAPIAQLASMIQTGSDTTFYVVSLYFGALNIKNHRFSLSIGLFLDFIACILALLIYLMIYV